MSYYKVITLGITGAGGRFYENKTKVDTPDGQISIPTVLTAEQLDDPSKAVKEKRVAKITKKEYDEVMAMGRKGSLSTATVPTTSKSQDDRFNDLVKQWSELTGKSEDEVPKNWGIPRITTEINTLQETADRTAKDDMLAEAKNLGIEQEGMEELEIEALTKLVKDSLSVTYKELAGDTAVEDTSEWTVEKFKAEIDAL